MKTKILKMELEPRTYFGYVVASYFSVDTWTASESLFIIPKFGKFFSSIAETERCERFSPPIPRSCIQSIARGDSFFRLLDYKDL